MTNNDSHAAAQNETPRRLAPEARRAQLLECAVRVFARRGIGEGRHAEIAREAGVSVATIFNYFPSREALVNAVLDEVGRFIIDEVVRPAQRGSIPAPQALLDIALGFAESMHTQPDYARVWLDWSTAVRGDLWPRYLGFQERVFELLLPTVERGMGDGSLPAGLDGANAVRLLVGSAHMIVQMELAGSDAASVRQFIESIIEGFIFRPPGGGTA